MKRAHRLIRVAALLVPFALSGCLWHTRRLPIPITPSNIETMTPDELVALLNDRWEKLQTLNATVEIQASMEKTQEGVARDYTSFRGIILLRKPGMLRVFGRMPVIGTTMFDMATNGKTFTLFIPSKSKAIKCSNKVKKKSANQLENLRPDFFYDAMVLRGLEPEDNYTVTADSETVEDAAKKHLLVKPEYIVQIMRPKPNSHEQTAVRSITLDRTNLMPYQQDIYDERGYPATLVTYSNYQDFGFGPYPGTITIRRPQENIQLVLTVEKVMQNMTLNDDQFAVKVPEGTEVQNLE